MCSADADVFADDLHERGFLRKIRPAGMIEAGMGGSFPFKNDPDDGKINGSYFAGMLRVGVGAAYPISSKRDGRTLSLGAIGEVGRIPKETVFRFGLRGDLLSCPQRGCSSFGCTYNFAAGLTWSPSDFLPLVFVSAGDSDYPDITSRVAI